MDDLEKRLQNCGRRLARHRSNESAALLDAEALAVEAATADKSEYLTARLLGVDRMTVRKWVGKR